MDTKEYLSLIAEQLVHELEPILKIKEVTSNTELLGKYAEALIRRLARRVVEPMRVSTGAVLDHPLQDPLRQRDMIIWAPFPVPGIFEVDDFALVPRSSAFGILEVKRSNYSDVDKALEQFYEKAPEIAAAVEPKLGEKRNPGMGVISVLDKPLSNKLRSLIEKERVVALFEKDGSSVTVRPKDVLVLVNYFQYILWRYRFRTAQPSITKVNTDLL